MSRGKAALSWVLRVALLVGALGLLVLASSQPAMAAPGRQFTSTGSPAIWTGTSSDGTVDNEPMTVDWAAVARGDQIGEVNQFPADQRYFYVALHANRELAGSVVPIQTPPTMATLTTAGGRVTEQAVPTTTAVDDEWFFPVSADVDSATLQVDGFTTVLGNEEGDFLPWTFGPLTVDFVATTPLPTSPTSVPTVTTHPHAALGSPMTIAAPSGSGTPLAAIVGVGVAGLAVVSAGGAGVVSLLRRRAFYRADREGRVMLSGPPIVVAGTALPAGTVLPDRHAIVVKLLGALEVEGTRQPVTAGPLLEIIVFLALNPGRTFSSAQLRESIWGLGRRPVTSASFRTYMTSLRKAFGPGVVVTEHFRYQLTDAVTCDWDRFRAVLQADDGLSGRQEALGLVRGPVLHGAFDGKQNSPFAWAVTTTHKIEDEVTNLAVTLTLDFLELGDSRRAAQAVSRGLLCSESNLRLRRLDIQVGSAVGGPAEVGRRLDGARAALGSFPHDVAELEEVARQLGWVASISD